MKSSLMPPGSTTEVRARSVLVLAPHFDDEVLGCGGLIARLAADGSVVRVLFLSDGSGGVEEVEDRPAYARRRLDEARRAVGVLRLQGFDRLDLPDGALDQTLDPLRQGIRRALLSQRPDLVLVTSPLETSADHRAAFRALHDVLASWQAGDEVAAVSDLKVLAYEVNHPLYPDLLVDVSAQLPLIERAMEAYASQQERHDYLAARLGLLRFRALSLPPGVVAVEAYRQLGWVDFTTYSPRRLIAELGGEPDQLQIEEGPLISVIVRTKDRPELLAEALASLARSRYRKAEVVVVNDGGRSPQLPADHPLDLRRVDLETNQGRAAAANAGVEVAKGDYIAFLDDDDLVAPEHLETLVGLVGGAGIRVGYTDAAVGVYEPDGENGWACTERRLPYSRDFDPDLLLCDNYIPFNTLLIERRLFDEVGPFDPSFAFFEDWDFLIRLSALTPFHHLAQVTCEYRHFRGAGHHILGDRPRQRTDFLATKARVLAKHTERLEPETLARVIDGLRAESIAQQESADRWRRESRRLEIDFHQLNGELASLKSYGEVLEVARERAEEEASTLRAQLGERDLELRRLYALEERLEGDIREQSERLAELYAEAEERIEALELQSSELERLHTRERQLTDEIESQSEELKRLYGQEKDLNAHLGRTYAEIERLNGLIDEMKQTRGWRLQEWWEKHRR